MERQHTQNRLHMLVQLIRFNLVGLLNTLIDFIVFFLLSGWGIHYLLANFCSYGCGIVNSYLCNKSWTFRSAGLKVTELVKFLLTSILSLVLSVLLVYLFHGGWGVPLVPSKVAATLLTMLASFAGSRFWVFKESLLEEKQ